MNLYISNNNKLTVNTSNALIDELSARNTVFVHTGNVDIDTTQRIIDFLSGACCALAAHLERISAHDFLLIPAGSALVKKEDLKK